MATGIDARIAVLLIEHAKSMTLPQATGIALPDVDEFIPVFGEPYIRLDFLPNETETVSIGTGQFKYQGLFQLSLMWPSRGGIINPLETTAVIQTSFDKGTKLSDATVSVRIVKRPSVSGPIIDGDRTMYPVTVEYQSFNT